MIQFLLTLALAGQLVANPKADFDNNGKVDFADFLLLANQFGVEQFDPRFDLDSNGAVNIDDFVAFAEVFGTQLSASKKADVPKDTDLKLEAAKLEEQAKDHRSKKEFAEAIEAYKKVLVLATDSLSMARGFKELGLTYWETDSLDQAIEMLEKVLLGFGESTDKEVRYELAGCATVLGQAFYLKQDTTRAKQYWKQIAGYLTPLE